MRGETVVFEDKVKIGENGYKEPVYETSEVEVGNVLVAPGATEDIFESNRNGDLVVYTLYFPKAFAGVLDGKRVKVRGEWCSVVGAPRPYGTAPTAWNLVAGVKMADG